ncbi:MAG: hypothetical protein IPK21_15395 [Haliscomenobacter sp.]|nr:hypothetical protein [Haliscomenobacter sp.]
MGLLVSSIAAFWLKAIAQLPGACPIQIANQSSEKLMFYLLESGAKLDSLTLGTIYGWMHATP